MRVPERLKRTPLYGVARRIYHRLKDGERRPSVFELNDSYNAQFTDVMRRIMRPDSTAVDIGAHRGRILSEMFAVAPQGRHFAFEPIPELAEFLAHSFPLARVYGLALSDRPDRTTFHHLLNNPEESGLRRHITHVPESEIDQIVVEVKRLDDVIPKDERVALFKIDAEGAELPIIRGGIETIQRSRAPIVFETGKNTTPFYEIGPADIFDTVTCDLGMSLSTMKRWLEGQRPYTMREFRRDYERTNEFYFMAY